MILNPLIQDMFVSGIVHLLMALNTKPSLNTNQHINNTTNMMHIVFSALCALVSVILDPNGTELNPLFWSVYPSPAWTTFWYICCLQGATEKMIPSICELEITSALRSSAFVVIVKWNTADPQIPTCYRWKGQRLSHLGSSCIKIFDELSSGNYSVRGCSCAILRRLLVF